MALNKVRFNVCGSQYVVSTTEEDAYVQKLAERLEEDMEAVLASNSNASVTVAAVVTAMGYLDERQKASSGADNMRGQIKDYLEDAAKARLAAEEARREVERLRREIQTLKEQNARA